MMEINQGFGERLLALEGDFSDRANSLQIDADRHERAC